MLRPRCHVPAYSGTCDGREPGNRNLKELNKSLSVDIKHKGRYVEAAADYTSRP